MGCLEPEEIEDFLAGRLAEVEAFEAHLDGCADCRELVAVLVQDSDRGPDASGPDVSGSGAGGPGAGGPGAHGLGPGELSAVRIADTLTDAFVMGGEDGDAGVDPSMWQSLIDEAPGRYHLLGEQGFGGQARVLAVYDSFTRREIALKELTPSGEGRDRLRTLRFIREARLAGQLNHPAIVQIHEMGRRPDGRLYYTMPMVRGITLTKAIADCKALTDRIALLDRFVDMCQGIAHAHSRGVVHRDLKPENVMLGEFGETVILDWGLAKLKDEPEPEPETELRRSAELSNEVDTEGLTADGTAVGTPSYMSPEQALAQHDQVDEQTDVWGLGAVLHEILTGRPPFVAPTAADVVRQVMRDPVRPVREAAPETPPELAAIVGKALQREKPDRYADVRALGADVSAFLVGRRVTSYGYSSWELLRLFARRNRGVLAAVGLVLTVIVIALVVLTFAYSRERRARADAAQALTRADAARAQERQERLAAELHLAQAYLFKADRLAREKDYLSAEVYAAASLLHNPGHPGSRHFDAGFSRRFPLSARLEARAASKLQLRRFSEITGRQWSVNFGSSVHRVAFSPSGEQLALACADRRVRLLDAADGRVLRELKGHGKPVVAVAYSPDGRQLASASRDRTLRLWNVRTGALVRTFRGHTRPVYRLAYSPDGQLLASAGMDGRIVLWSTADGSRVRVLTGHRAEVKGVAFSPDGKQLASASSDRTVRLWEVATGKTTQTFDDYRGAVTAAVYSADGQRLASVSRDSTVRIRDLKRGRLQFVFQEKDAGYLDVSFWSQRQRLVAAQTDGVIRVFDASTGRLRTSVKAHAGLVSSLAVSPDGRRVASAGQDGYVKVWSLATSSRTPAEFAGHRELVFGVAFSPDGRRLASGSLDGTVRLWRTSDGAALKRLVGHREEVTKVAFSPNGRWLASASKDGSVALWDSASGERRHVLKGHRDMVYGVAFSPDNRRLASGGLDGTVRVWDVATGESVHVLKPPGHLAFSVAYSPDGRRLATASSDRAVTLFDAKTGRKLRTLVGQRDYVTGVAFIGDRQLASGGKDGLVMVWDLGSGKPRLTLRGHRAWVNSVKVSPDRRYVASASDDRTVRIWSVATGRPVMIIDTSTVAVALAFAPKGNTVAVGDGVVVRMYSLVEPGTGLHPRVLLRRAERVAGLKLEGFLGRPVE